MTVMFVSWFFAFIGYKYKSYTASKGPSIGLWLLYKQLLPWRNAYQDVLMLLCKIPLTHLIYFCSTLSTAEKAHLESPGFCLDEMLWHMPWTRLGRKPAATLPSQCLAQLWLQALILD